MSLRDSTAQAGSRQLKAANGRVVAAIEGGRLVKRVRGSVHMLQRPRRAWAWDQVIIDQAEAAGVTVAQVFDSETGETWSAALAEFRQHGFAFDRGWGPQVALSLEHWTRGGELPPVQMAFAF